MAVLPLGATEPHNLHLPYGTDTFQVQAIGELACERAFEGGARVVLLPTIPYGTETNLMRFPLAMNLDPSTVAKVVADLVDSLAAHGVRKCVLLNGHGGNDLKWMLRELYGKTPVHLFACNWYKVAADRHADIFEEAGDHAGELETSMGLAHFPGLVAMEQADPGALARPRFEAVNRGWVEITRPWHLLTTNTGAGDPRPATAAKGRAITEAVVARLADFLVELAASPLDETFPFRPEERAGGPGHDTEVAARSLLIGSWRWSGCRGRGAGGRARIYKLVGRRAIGRPGRRGRHDPPRGDPRLHEADDHALLGGQDPAENREFLDGLRPGDKVEGKLVVQRRRRRLLQTWNSSNAPSPRRSCCRAPAQAGGRATRSCRTSP